VHQREKKNQDALLMWEEELSLREKDLNARESTVVQKEEILTDREKSLTDEEKSLKADTNSIDDRRRRLEQKSLQFRSMPPENAVKIMREMDLEEVVEILRVTEELAVKENEQSIVPYWISLMTPERAAEVDRLWR
jgi:flagellar protein FlbB